MALKKKRKPTSIPDLDNKRPLKRKGFYTLFLTALLGMFLFVTYYAVQQVQVYQSSAKGQGATGQACGPKLGCPSGYKCVDRKCQVKTGGSSTGSGSTSCSGLSKNKCGSTKGCYFDPKKRECVKSGSSSTGSGSTTTSGSTGTTSSGNGGSNCSSAGGVCKSSCSSGETKLTGDYCTANPGKVCCKASSGGGGTGSTSCSGLNKTKCNNTKGCEWNTNKNKCVTKSSTADCSKIGTKNKCNDTKGCEWNADKNKCVDKSGGGGDGSNPCKDAGGACRVKSNGCGVDETQSGKSCAGLDSSNKVCCLPATAGSNPCKDAGNACRTKANGCGEGELETDLACAGPNPDKKICCEVVDELPPGVVGTATFDMSLSFQGIIGLPLSGETTMDVLVTLAGGELVEPVSQTTTFAVDNNGVWTGEASFDNITSGSGYKLLVKGPKHMQKKVCEVTPTETKPGTYHCGDGDITVSVDTINTVDFSGIRLLVGDLPSQDGVVDAYDVSLIRNGFCTTENPDICKDSKLLSEADLNLDGIIDSQDHSLVISSLSIKYDEL